MEIGNDNEILTGGLGFSQVDKVLGNTQAFIAGDTLDLSKVTSIDSAGVSLLLELTRRARTAGRTLVIRGASRRIRELITFFRVSELLNFEGAEAKP